MIKKVFLNSGILIIFILIMFSNCQQTGSGGGGGGNSSGGGIDGDIQSKEIAIDPVEVSLPSGGIQQFDATVTGYANTSVNWDILEGQPNGGTIDQDGLYTAPNTAGDYHVIVTSKSDISKKDTAIVHVIAGWVSSGGTSADKYYKGTITIDVTGTGSMRGPNWSHTDNATLNVYLDYDPAQSSNLISVWSNLINADHLEAEVTGSINEKIISNGNTSTISSNGVQSFTSNQLQMQLILNAQKKTLYIVIGGIIFEICSFQPANTQGPWAILGAYTTVPLPIDLYHISGSAKADLYNEYPATLTWDLELKSRN
jgi:hypothetical protein